MRIIDIALLLPTSFAVQLAKGEMNSGKFSPLDVEGEWNGCGNTQNYSLGNNGLIDAQLLYTINPHPKANH
jgi:hypothetical protein